MGGPRGFEKGGSAGSDRGAPGPGGRDEAETQGAAGQSLESQATAESGQELWRPGWPRGPGWPEATREQWEAPLHRARGQSPATGLGSKRLGPGGGSGRRSAAFFAFSSPTRPPSGSVRSIDTCAGPAPAANIFLMSSQGLKPARSALQGGFSPGRCFGRRRCFEARGGGWQTRTNLSSREGQGQKTFF